MPHNTIGNANPEHEATTLQRTLATVASQEAEHDSRRRRLFMERSRATAALHVDKLSGDWAMTAGFAASELERPRRSALDVASDTASAPDDRSAAQELVQTPSQLGIGVWGTTERMPATAAPFGSSPSSGRRFPNASVIIERLSQAERSSMMSASGDPVREIVQAEKSPGPGSANDLTAQPALTRATAIKGQIESLATADVSLRNENQWPDALIAALTPDQADSLGPEGIGWRQQIHDNSSGRDPDSDSQSRRISAQRAIAEQADAKPFELASLFGGPGNSLSYDNTRSDSRFLSSSSDRGSGSNALESIESPTSMQSPADEALAAAAHEVERLRAAVRETIDELERVRGSVRPALPALPVNRGSFRIS